MRTYPLLAAKGGHRELGRQHGEQAGQQIRGLLDWLAHALKLNRTQLQSRASRFEPLFARHCPHLLDEVHGLAEGADLPFADALVVQLRGELGAVGDGGCTTYVAGPNATADGSILIGQNSDLDPGLEELGYVLRLEPTGNPAILMWTFGGMIGYHGVNSAGVAHFANSLGGGPPWRFALSHYPVKRLMHEQTSLDGVRDLFRRVPVCSSGNYALCDGAGHVAFMELTAEGFEESADPAEGFLVHANHFLCGAHAYTANDAVSLPDSFTRQERMQQLVASKAGTLTVAAMQKFLADHAGHPVSICRHPHEGPDHPSVSARGATAASIVAEPLAGRMHVCRGNPCEGKFETYRL